MSYFRGENARGGDCSQFKTEMTRRYGSEPQTSPGNVFLI